MATPGARLRRARRRAGYDTAKAAAKAAGVGEVSFRAYENDQHGYSKHATTFARVFKTTSDWLLDGVGEEPKGKTGDASGDASPVVTSNYDKLADDIALVRSVDISYAMGDGAFIEEYPDTEFVPFSLSFLRQFTNSTTDALFICTGHGDSMEPTLRREDRLLIDTAQRTLSMQDRVWALSYEGVGMVKRVRLAGKGQFLLLSDNPGIPPQEVNMDDVHLVGRVVWVARIM